MTAMDKPSEPSIGKVAYAAYCLAVKWRSVHGEPLPMWGQQDPRIQRAWDHAATAVLRFNGPPADWSESWDELTDYVQAAVDDGGQIDSQRLLDLMVELKRGALEPVLEWRALRSHDPEAYAPWAREGQQAGADPDPDRGRDLDGDIPEEADRG